MVPGKLFPKGVIESCSAHSCAPQLLQKVVQKAAPQSCSRNLLPKIPEAAPELLSTVPKLVPKVVSKMLPKITPQIIQSCCWKLFPKFLVNACPKVAGLQSKCCSSSSSSSSSRREKKYIGTSLNGYIANKNEKIKIWGYRIVSADSKIILYLWKWSRGTVLCPQDFGVIFFIIFNCFLFLFLIIIILV